MPGDTNDANADNGGGLKKNRIFDHAFAIVRIDYPVAEQVNCSIVVKEVLWDLGKAEQEVKRLNELNGHKGCLYFWQTTRIERQDASESKET